MAKEKKLVEQITSRDVDFAKWYTDIVKKAELIEYSDIKGCMIIRPQVAMLYGKISKKLWTVCLRKQATKMSPCPCSFRAFCKEGPYARLCSRGCLEVTHGEVRNLLSVFVLNELLVLFCCRHFAR